ncbi:MAG: hypothetical protein A2081_00260 [Elusimicrobia bacterium GWC2_61_19]|nr:MAG: hypothetical protein A2081_00260 [Elusimicrobia bacterium GWC2_61_19]
MKYVLIAFVAVSVGAVVYKNLPCCSGDKTQAAPVEAAAATEAAQPVVKAEAKTPAKAVKPAAKAAIEAKTAVVYYFYTNTRCSSCKTIEAYTREAVATKLAAGYKDWKVEFKGVNVDDEANKHFVQDYWLNSKSVVVQKFAGEKPLKWGKLDKVWQLLGDKEAFMAYVADETHKLLDAK